MGTVGKSFSSRKERKTPKEEAEDSGDDSQVDPLRRINGAGKHLAELVNDILDLSKIEARRMDLPLRDFDLVALLEEAVTTARPLAETGNNQLALDCEETPQTMHTDPTRPGYCRWFSTY